MLGDLLLQIGIIVLLLLLNGFLAGSEIAIVSVRKPRVKQLAEDGSRAARTVLRVSENMSRFLATVQVGITITGFFASAVGAVSISQVLAQALRASGVDVLEAGADAIALVVVTLLISYFSLIFGELVPKNLGLHHAEGWSLRAAGVIELFGRFTAPVVALLTGSTNLILRLFGVRERATFVQVTEDEIISMVDAGEEEGVFESFEREMIRGVFDFGDTVVREIMVPRIDIVALEKGAPVQRALDTFLRVGISRMPIFDGTIDDIVGVLYAKDLLRYFSGQSQPEGISALARPPVFVPETKALSELFRELQVSRTQMAIVVDEYGGTAGLVTMEDMLEEIVGEIRDEYDVEESRLVVLSGDELLANGTVSVGDLEDALNVRMDGEAEDVDTIAGVVYSSLGRIPVPGDKVELNEVTLTVEAVSGRRIRQVRVLRRPRPTDENGE
ncbi:MAG: hemolysin family protein [Chloroflexota bacterium]